jgi:oligopeptidase B
VLDYLQAENEYADAYFKPLQSLQETLYKEMTSRLAPDDASVPYKKGGYTYTTRYESGKDYPIYSRIADGQEKEEVLLDVNVLAEGQKYTGVTAPRVSPDNQYVAYGQDFVSRRIYTIVVKDLKTGKMLQDTLRDTGGNLAWAADSKHLYYVGKDVPTLRNNRIYRHTLGQPQSEDELLWDETDETFSVHLQQSVDDKYILAVSSHTLTTDVRYIAASDVTGPLKEFTPRTVGHKYTVDHIGQTFYILTDRDNSLNRKIMTVSDTELKAGKPWKNFLA